MAIRDRVAQRLDLIEIEAGAVDKLRSQLYQWVIDVACDPSTSPTCSDAEMAEQELIRVLRDSSVYSEESPLFYDMVQTLAGPDHYLSESEINRQALELTLVAPEDRPRAADPNEEFIRSITRRVAIRFNENRLLTGSSVDGKLPLFREDRNSLDRLRTNVEGVRGEFRNLIGVLETIEDDLTEESLSFFNFISAENFFGYSAYFTYDGAPWGASEIQGLRRALAHFRQVAAGLDQLMFDLRRGIVNFRHPDVAAFIDSPLADLAGIPRASSEYPLKAQKEDVDGKADNFMKFVGWVAGTLYDFDARRTAYDVAESVVDGLVQSLGPEQVEKYEYQIEQHLGSVGDEFYYQQFVPVGNSVASYEGVALGGVGGIAAKLLGKIGRIAKLVADAGSAFGKAKFFLPGTAFFAVSRGTTTAAKVGLGVAATGCEVVRLAAYQWVAGKVAGRAGQEWVGRAYMVVGGMVSTLHTDVMMQLADELMAGKKDGLLAYVLSTGVDEDDVARLARSMADSVNRKADDVLDQLQGMRLEALQAERVAAVRSGIEFERARQALRRMLARGKADLGDEFSARAREAEGLADKVEAARRMSTLLDEGREIIRRIDEQRLAAMSAAPTTSTHSGSAPQDAPPSMGRRGRRKTPQGDSPRPPTPLEGNRMRLPEALEQAIGRPPEAVTSDVVATLSGGKVSVASTEVERRLARFYRDVPDKRGSIWRRVGELVLGNSEQMKPVKDEANVFHLRVGIRFRLFVRRLPDGNYVITNIEKRGAIGWSEA